MGRPKRELKKIHAKKVEKAKSEIKKYEKGDIPYEKLTQRARSFLGKRKKTKKS